MKEIKTMAERRGLKVHLDGARLFNAACALNVDVKQITACVDSVSCCLSKGLCAPIGSVLCGSRELIACARKNRKLLGGGMRQTGVLAAAGILSLTEMPKRLGEDHQNAKYLAQLLSELPGVTVDPSAVQINMVFAGFDWPNIETTLPADTEYGATLEQITIECLAQLIVTDGDVEAEYAAFVERWENEGGLVWEAQATEAYNSHQ